MKLHYVVIDVDGLVVGEPDAVYHRLFTPSWLPDMLV